MPDRNEIHCHIDLAGIYDWGGPVVTRGERRIKITHVYVELGSDGAPQVSPRGTLISADGTPTRLINMNATRHWSRMPDYTVPAELIERVRTDARWALEAAYARLAAALSDGATQ